MPRPAVVIHAHPYPDRSRAGRALLEELKSLETVEVRSLYSLYPDFAIDVESEQNALLAAEVIVWQTPFYWYGVPALLHHWFEKVLEFGWAYGEGGDKLRGKSVLFATTTGAPVTAYRPEGVHGYPFDRFVPPIAQTARFCGMTFEDPPFVVHGAQRLSDAELGDAAKRYRERVKALLAEPVARLVTEEKPAAANEAQDG